MAITIPRRDADSQWLDEAERRIAAERPTPLLPDDEMDAELDSIATLIGEQAITPEEGDTWFWRLLGMKGNPPPVERESRPPAILVPFEPYQLPYFRPGSRETEIMALPGFSEALRGWSGKAVSLIEGGRVLGIGGMAVTGGEGMAWVLLSDELRRRPILLHRTIVRGLRDLRQTFDIKRTAVTVKADDRVAKRWLERLGFRHEEMIADPPWPSEIVERYIG